MILTLKEGQITCCIVPLSSNIIIDVSAAWGGEPFRELYTMRYVLKDITKETFL
jgi:hypothetical protein